MNCGCRVEIEHGGMAEIVRCEPCNNTQARIEHLENSVLVCNMARRQADRRVELLTSACHAALHHIGTAYHKRIVSTSGITDMLSNVLGLRGIPVDKGAD